MANYALLRILRNNPVELDSTTAASWRSCSRTGASVISDLADRIGLSPSSCLRRMRTLDESGLVVGYRALLDAKRLGLSLMALIHISMDRHTPDRFDRFEKSIGELPEVLECLLITGQDADYQIKVIVRDMDDYQELLLNKITRIDGVTGVHSSFVLRRVVYQTALPLLAGNG